MNEGQGRIEALNQAVRALVTLALAGGFIFGFIVLGKISGDVYTTVVSGIIGYWFAARSGEQVAKQLAAAAASGGPNGTKPPIPTTGTEDPKP